MSTSPPVSYCWTGCMEPTSRRRDSMSEASTAGRDLIHRLNGQLLEALKDYLGRQLGDEWKPGDWIINVILLNRSSDSVYTARLETSATSYKDEELIFDRQDRLDPTRVGVFDLPVPLDRSFSGYCIKTGDPVWVNNLNDVDPTHPLYKS